MFNVKKSSNKFQELFNKYKKQLQIGKKYRNFSILMFFDQHRNKVEDDEKEEDFLFRDLKNMRREEKELIEEYGTNAKNEFHSIKDKNFKIKLEKNIFFNGFESTERNNKKNKKIIKINEINLPNIFNKRNYSNNNLDVIKNSIEELKNNINNENNNFSKKNSIKKIKSRNNSLINNLYNYNSCENNKNNNNNIKIKHQRNKSYNYYSIDNNNNNSERKNYIQTLNDERNKFIKEKNKYYYVFNKNQKKSEKLDKKLNFIETKYFNF
jgi:hypothetical protein